jgi:hypothetical protein
MSVTILTCPCGMRLKATGALPGKSGRCPKCGGLLKVPDASKPVPAVGWSEEDETLGTGYEIAESPDEVKPAKIARTEVDEMTGMGYGLTPDEPPPAIRRGASEVGGIEAPELEEWNLARQAAARSEGQKSQPLRSTVANTPSLLYPFSGPDSVGVLLIVGTALWFLTILVPEYCLALIADGEKSGAQSMGFLIALITALPVLFMLPPVFVYWLQYLGRVLVASGEGEARPPRSPDRNLDGLINGLSPWFLWLILGVGIGLLPFVIYRLLVDGDASSPEVGLGLVAIGFPYAMMALLLCFLHDEPLAATPAAVIGTILKLLFSFAVLCLMTVVILGLPVAAFVGSFALRNGNYGLYVLASLGSWYVMLWSSIVTMRRLGVYYHQRSALLGWQEKRARWGVSWKI